VRLLSGGRRAMVRVASATLLALVALATLPALVACTSRGSQAAPAASSSSMTDAQLQVLVDELVTCVRNNGAPGVPDLKVENGKVIIPDENTVDEATKRNIDTALEACKSVQERIPPSVFQEGQQEGQRESSERREPTAQDVPALRAWAQCGREHGIPEWPDPRPDGSFPLAGTPLEQEGKSPRLMDAWQACKQHWDGGIKGS
jgi:hypothetical protein